MSTRNPESLWNPAKPARVSPEEYERQVVEWLSNLGQSLVHFEVRHLDRLGGAGGEYELDAVAEFSVLGGAKIVVLVECKRYSKPVEREKLLSLWAKLQDVGAHKAMIFATCGFQSGALQYARERGIATITFAEGSFLYETRGGGESSSPPSWVRLPTYVGLLVKIDGSSITTTAMPSIHALANWLTSSSG